MSKFKALALLSLMAVSVPSCSSEGNWDYSASLIYIDNSAAYDANSASNLAFREDLGRDIAVLYVRYDVRTTEYGASAYQVTNKYVGHPYRIVRKTT